MLAILPLAAIWILNCSAWSSQVGDFGLRPGMTVSRAERAIKARYYCTTDPVPEMFAAKYIVHRTYKTPKVKSAFLELSFRITRKGDEEMTGWKVVPALTDIEMRPVLRGEKPPQTILVS